MSTDPARHAALTAFARRQLDDDAIAVMRASADASFRSYWRVTSRGASFIVMDAPPGREPIGPWLDIARRLRAAGLNAPEVLAEDRAQGFVLMSDLGHDTYLPLLDDGTADALYRDALAALLTMQTRVDATGLAPYDEPRLRAEMALLPEWFLVRHLGLAPGCQGWDLIEDAFTRLVRSALEQPVAFVHRDFHSRNLMRVPRNNPGILDFQDAVVGPVTYDLVSLLRDCYVAWPPERVAAWSEQHRERLVAARLLARREPRWTRWFDWMGLQRHLKVLGIFCRLWYRDGKSAYLGDLPRVMRYTLEVAGRYRELAPFAAFLARAAGERDLSRPRDAAA